jgi:predicted Co/Zn/Cd cation transporter (cation efflux family)
VPWVFFFFTAFFDGKNMGFTMGKWWFNAVLMGFNGDLIVVNSDINSG